MNTKKKKYIFFTKPHLNHLWFLLFFIISMTKTYFIYNFPQNQTFVRGFFCLYLYNFGDFISIIPVLIIKIRTKSKKNDIDYQKANQNDINYIYTNIEKEAKYKGKAIKIIFIFTIADFIAQISYIILNMVLSELEITAMFISLNSTLIINVIVIFLLSYFILKTKVFRHHYFCLMINILFLIVLTVIDIREMVINDLDNIGIQILFLLTGIFCTILYSIEDVLGKVLFLYHYYSPYSLLLTKALIEFFYFIIFGIPFFFIKLKDTNGEKKLIFSMIVRIFDDKINILNVIIIGILSFFFNLTIFKIIDIFSPNHFVIARYTENIGAIIDNIILKGVDSEKYLALRIIIYIIIDFFNSK